MNREELIEKAAKAIWFANHVGSKITWGEMAWSELTMPDDWNQEALDALEEARAAFAVFEESLTPAPSDDHSDHARCGECAEWPKVTPSNDEREALDYAIRTPIAERGVDYKPLWELIRDIQDSVLAAGFHRTPSAVKQIKAMPIEEVRAEIKARRTVQGEPSDALIEEALAWIGRAWDDGNASGLDGWIGPGRGAGMVDREAQHARTRMIHKTEAALHAAFTTQEGEGRD